MTTKIVIIGLGFVGDAVYNSLYRWHDDDTIKVIDPSKGFNTSYTEIANYDAAFICVPSPQSSDGTADTSILESVLANLEQVNFKGVIISKVTAPPGVYKWLNDLYPNLVHAPEFLTAANAKHDYLNGSFSIIGGSVKAYINEAERIIRISQANLKTVTHCSIQEAALAKYSINSFLATKVIFMNELALLAEKLDCNWETVRNAITLDKRIGDSHMQVPGPDGSYGFGGMCFPKDTSALLKCAEEATAQLSVLDTVVKTNLILRLTEPK